MKALAGQLWEHLSGQDLQREALYDMISGQGATLVTKGGASILSYFKNPKKPLVAKTILGTGEHAQSSAHRAGSLDSNRCSNFYCWPCHGWASGGSVCITTETWLFMEILGWPLETFLLLLIWNQLRGCKVCFVNSFSGICMMLINQSLSEPLFNPEC